jgi:hypothetical protein
MYSKITIIPKPFNPPPGGSSLMSWLALHVELQSEPTTHSNENLKAKIKLKQGAMQDKTTPLTWWQAGYACLIFLALQAHTD